MKKPPRTLAYVSPLPKLLAESLEFLIGKLKRQVAHFIGENNNSTPEVGDGSAGSMHVQSAGVSITAPLSNDSDGSLFTVTTEQLFGYASSTSMTILDDSVEQWVGGFAVHLNNCCRNFPGFVGEWRYGRSQSRFMRIMRYAQSLAETSTCPQMFTWNLQQNVHNHKR
jgi:hypothetical protein